MFLRKLKSDEMMSDEEFDTIYSDEIKLKADFHFTPVAVAALAAIYLTEISGTKVLDIGSGGGKFCIVGASRTDGHFTGVEQREELVFISNAFIDKTKLPNVNFIHANILDINMLAFDAFYFFNPFYENIDTLGAFDNSVVLHRSLYIDYCVNVRGQLDKMPIGTRIATYFSYSNEIPTSYEFIDSHMDGKLKFWKKNE